jgi:hypothetical protein
VRAAYTTAFNANPGNFVVPPSGFQVLGGYTFANEDNRNVWEADRSNFQPRIGASYSLNDKTVLRAGFGMFMAPFMIETPQQIGFAGTTPFVPSNNNGLTFVATLTNPFPQGLAGVQPSFGSSLGLLTGIGADVASSDLPDHRSAAQELEIRAHRVWHSTRAAGPDRRRSKLHPREWLQSSGQQKPELRSA